MDRSELKATDVGNVGSGRTGHVFLPQLAMSVGSASHMLGESETVLEGVYALLADQEARLASIEHTLSGDTDGPKG